jgi:hypothetical protein
MLKSNKALMVFNILILILVGLLSYTTISTYKTTQKTKDQIYFDIWYNQILYKNEMRKLLENKDPFDGSPVETNYQIDEEKKLSLKMIKASIKYAEVSELKTKTYQKSLNIYLEAFNINDGSFFKYTELPELVSGKICGNIIYLLGENQLYSNGVEIDATKNHIDFITCYFMLDINEMADGEPVGGITYKRSEKPGYFNFEIFRVFDDANFS